MKLVKECSVLLAVIMICACSQLAAQEEVDITTGVDIVSRYFWRGLDIANTPSLQPTLAVGYAGFEIGSWGAYTLSNEAFASDEIDFWLSYTQALESGVELSVMVIDYYFPNSGVDFFNFNNYDDEDGAGAHTLEIGASVSGPESFPIGVSGYINVYNDAGNNTYFQLDYNTAVNETELNFFIGGTGGSEDNPGYYGTDETAIINIGVTGSREIQISDEFILPLFVTFAINPKAEISYMVAGISL